MRKREMMKATSDNDL